MGKKKIDINAKKGVDVNRVMEAAGLLKDSVVDEQAKKIKILEKSLKMNEELAERYHLELEKLQEDYKSLAAHFDGLCAERDNLAACLKSAENALAYKDKVIERIKKKNAKRMSEKCEVISVLNKEIEFQYKRREKAEKFVNTLGQAFDLLKKNVEDYEHSIGR
jgi:chromosome segregation ATPase